MAKTAQKASNGFKVAIQAHLDMLAFNDPLFRETLQKPKKNIDDCVTYILNEVKKSGQEGFADEEIYKMAVHYYDEDDIKIGDKNINAKVVVNHHKPAPPKPVPAPTASKTATPAPSKPVAKPVPTKADLLAKQHSLF